MKHLPPHIKESLRKAAKKHGYSEIEIHEIEEGICKLAPLILEVAKENKKQKINKAA